MNGVFKMERRKYDKEFKLEILRLIEEEVHSVAQVARGFGTRAPHSPVEESLQEPQEPFPGKGDFRKEEAPICNSERRKTGYRIEVS